jgi:flavodoxin
MNYNGNIYRPPIEAHTMLIPVTEGCTHNKCTFCNMYQNVPFRMWSLNEVEKYVAEIKSRYPMWWYTFPMIIYTLFDKYDFSGKTIIPFNTHMGSHDGGTYDTIRELEPNATVVMNGLPVEMKTAETGAAKQVEKWLKSLNI